jgi:thioesterase domain-containing protein
MKASLTDEAHAVTWRGILRIARHLQNRTPIPTEQFPLPVRLRKGAAENPLYFIGIGLWELQLAQLISSNNSIFAIEIPWPSAWHVAAVGNRTPSLPTMEQLVAPYVSTLSAHARFSPCVLVGNSFNGLMAFEAAHQINRRGGKVKAVMLLDSKAKYPAPHMVAWEKLKQDWQRIANSRSIYGSAQTIVSFFSMLQWMFVSELKLLWRRFKHAALGDLGVPTMRCDDLGKPLYWASVERIYSNAAKNYRLHCLDSRGVLFRADPKEERPAPALDGSLGWDNLFRDGLEIIPVTGDHLTMMQKPHNLALAREMSKVLDRFCEHHHRLEQRAVC